MHLRSIFRDDTFIPKGNCILDGFDGCSSISTEHNLMYDREIEISLREWENYSEWSGDSKVSVSSFGY